MVVTDQEGVLVVAAIERIGPRTAGKRVIAGAAIDSVIVFAADQAVIARPTEKRVVALVPGPIAKRIVTIATKGRIATSAGLNGVVPSAGR
ncbi:MAG: hypothetical protein AAF557_23125 [Pseudomonadota bacterium]